MLFNYLITAIRQLGKSKLTSTINLAGFTIALFLTLVVALILQLQYSFDKQFSSGKDIYRIIHSTFQNSQSSISSLTKFPMGPTLMRNFPEVIATTRVQVYDANVVTDYAKTVVSHMARADSSFFILFDFKILQGDRSQLLSKPNSIVLTESLANELFPNVNPIGKPVKTGSAEYYVTGVLENLPENTHLHFQAIRSFSSAWAENNANNWGPSMVNTYLLLNESANKNQLEAKLPSLLQNYLAEEAEHTTLSLQALHDIHLKSGYLTNDNNNWRKFNQDYITYLLVLTLLIVLVVAFNYINISAATAIDRAKEVGLRKTVGASKYQIAFQFIAESVLFCLLSAFTSVALFHFLAPYINQYFNINLAMDWSWNFLLSLAIFAVTVGGLAGLLPSVSASLLNPVLILKGNFSKAGKTGVRNVLVMTQFTFAVIIILCALHVSKQLNFIRNKDLGFSKEQVVGLQFPNNREAYEGLKNRYTSLTGIVDVTAAGHALGKALSGWSLRTRGNERELGVSVLTVDRNYVDFFDMQLIEGNDFKNTLSGNSKTYVVNETLSKAFGWKSGVNQQLGFAEAPDDSLGHTIGVVRDFHFESLHSEITPLALHIQGNDIMSDEFSELYVKVVPHTDFATLIKEMETVWNDLVPDQPFSYYFLDKSFERFYENDRLLGHLADSVAIMSGILAFMGLFAVSYLSIKSQIKAVVVRKIVGASNQNIVKILITPLAKLIVISSLLAAPIAYLLISIWLESFAYRISIDANLFTGAILIMSAVSILSTAWQITKALRVNPVNVLRHQ